MVSTQQLRGGPAHCSGKLLKHSAAGRAIRALPGQNGRSRAVTVIAHGAGHAAHEPVTDIAVPEGHKGLHTSLYGSGGAEDAHATSQTYKIRKEHDDGSLTLPVATWLVERDGEKPLGVYALYSEDGKLQYLSYSRNMVTAVRGHLSRVGPQLCAGIRAMVFANKAMATREHLERQVQTWLEAEGGVLPPGNDADRELWEGAGAGKVLSESERVEYEEKVAKLRRAMGEGREAVLAGVEAGTTQAAAAASNGVQGSPEELKRRREDMIKAVEGDNWSAVIDQQTQQATGAPAPVPAPSRTPPSADGHSDSSSNGSATKAASAAGSSSGSGPVVSPFAQPQVHRTIGEKEQKQKEALPMTVESVDSVLNEVRPYLMADGGDVEVVEVKDGNIFLRLQGSCSTCASSASTMKMGIERALQAAFGDALKEVIQVDKVDVVTATAANIDMHLNMLRGAIHSFGGSVEVVEVSGGVCKIKYSGPPAIGKGVSAAVKDRFPEVKEVVLV